MHKLFRKAFVMVWLTMTASIACVFVVSNLARVFPLEAELQERQVTFVLDAAASLLKKDGPEVTKRFISSSTFNPLAMTLAIETVAPSGNCAAKAGQHAERFILYGPTCYHLSARTTELGLLSRYGPKLVPWVSALLAAAGAAFWIARYLTSPVEELKAGLSALAQGRFDARIGDRIDKKRDEVAALAHDFDITATRLERFQEAQRRLFHDVSHELRSPLSRLQAAIGVLRKNPARLDAMLERLEREITRMDDLVGEILTLAKLTAAQQPPMERQTVDLIDLVREIVDDSAFESASKQISVVYEGAHSFVTQIDGELIYRAVENVIRNAVKYSPASSRVVVSGERVGAEFVLRVADQGAGVSKDALSVIFQPFKRGSDHQTAETGFGLGLSITKHAFEGHGGRVKADLRNTGGLIITMTLPLEGNLEAVQVD